jgi:hypothetical protein
LVTCTNVRANRIRASCLSVTWSIPAFIYIYTNEIAATNFNTISIEYFIMMSVPLSPMFNYVRKIYKNKNDWSTANEHLIMNIWLIRQVNKWAKRQNHVTSCRPCWRNFDTIISLAAIFNRPLAHDVTSPVTMHLEDKLAIYA